MARGEETLQARPGTYVLVQRCRATAVVAVGRWGRLRLRPGFYLYVGSAFGAGGVRSRVLRHCRARKPRRWHLDYLREFLVPREAWCSYAPTRLEHDWAAALRAIPGISAVRGFGCSDCGCFSHLFIAGTGPDITEFSALVQGGPVACSRLDRGK